MHSNVQHKTGHKAAFRKLQLLLHYYSIIVIVSSQYYLHKIVLNLNIKPSNDAAHFSLIDNFSTN